MAWISSHTVLMRHRKLIELARELRLKPVYVLGHLHALWHNALEQAEDGDLSQWSDEFISESACYSGDAPQFVSLLQKYKWLDNKIIHDWLDYVGKFLIVKYKDNNKKRLEEIWSKHGQAYGSKEKQPLRKGSGKEVVRKQKGSLYTTSSSFPSSSLDSIKKKPVPAKAVTPNLTAKKLSQDLYDFLIGINPDQKQPNFESWTRVFDLMLRVDNRTEEQIRYILNWLYKSTDKNALFWRRNILSPNKLRDHFDRLILIVKDLQPKTNGVNDMIQGLLNDIDKEDLNNAKAVLF